MKILKNRNYKIFLIAIIIVLIFFLCAIDSKAQEQLFDPISYDFENNVLYDKDGSFEPDMYNIREQFIYTENYIAKYSFEHDEISSEPKGFITNNGIGCSTEVISSLDGHSKVLKIYDNSDIAQAYISQEFEQPKLFGNISFWINLGDVDIDYLKYVSFDCYDDLNELGLRFLFSFELGDSISYYYDGNWYLLESGILENQWYNLRFDFNCVSKTTNFYINEILIYPLIPFSYDISNINKISFATRLDSEGFIPIVFYIDGLDYSWSDSYYNNRNLIPQKEYTNQLEVDKYEFDYNSEQFEINRNSWTQNEYNETTNDIQVKVPGDQSINKYMSINAPAYVNTYQNGIQFNDNSSGYIIDVSLSMEIYFIDIWCAHFIYIFTQNINLNYPIAMKLNGATNSIDVYNISSLGYESFSTFTDQVIYEINFYLNYYDNIMIISLNSTEGFNEIFLSLDDNDKWNNLYGLDYIQVNNSISSMGDFGLINLYNVGIYENGKYFQSILDNREFGLMIHPIPKSWNSLNHNLITVNSRNDYKLYVFSNCAKFDCGFPLRDRSVQTKREIINIAGYTGYTFVYGFPFLVFMLFDNFSIPYEIEIEGVSLVDNNGIKTNARYIYDNTYPNRYFFYCIDNKLYYNFSNSYKLGIETMTIIFDVKDVLLDDSFLFSYTSYITDDYNGLVTLESYEFHESFNIPNDIKPINSVYNVSLEQEFTLTEIRIDIKTDLLDFASGYTSGYIQNLNLYYDEPLTPDYDPISVLELDFLEAMIFIVIRLIFFLIPSLIFRTKFGNKSILPMWLLIGLILFISGLIPFWLFFIQIIAIGSMLMLNRSKEVD